MADPVTLSMIAAGTAVAAGGIQAVGELQRGRAALEQGLFAEQAADIEAEAVEFASETAAVNERIEAENAARLAAAQAEADEFNAAVSEQEARQARAAGEDAADDFVLSASAKRATERARQAATGATGQSPLLVDDAVFEQIEVGRVRIASQAELVAARKEQEAGLLRTQAGRARETGRLAREGGLFAAATARQAGRIQRRSILARGRADLRAGEAGRRAGQIGAVSALVSGVARGASIGARP